MPVVEHLMKAGSWDLELVPETPKTIRDVLQPYGHIVICEARVDPRVMLGSDLLGSVALYVGPLRRLPTPYKLGGAGMAIYLGDEEDKGNMFEGATGWNLTNGTFVNWMAQFVGAGIAAGTTTAIGGTLTQNYTRQPARPAVDDVCHYFGGEWRVNNNATLDGGPSSSLFKTTPTVIAMPREGGRELNGLIGIEPSTFNLEVDADSFTTKVLLVGATGTGTATQTNPYKDLLGGALNMERVVTNPQATAGQENAQATAAIAQYPLRQSITLTTDRYDIVHDIRAGDWMYVYDPEHDIVDLTNPQNYRGQITYPLKLRVFAITWPVEAGMTVFYRDLNGAYTDITNWLVPEPPGTSFELGAPARGLTVF